MEYIIEKENLTKQYVLSTVVDNNNLHMPKGKTYGFAAANMHKQELITHDELNNGFDPIGISEICWFLSE